MKPSRHIKTIEDLFPKNILNNTIRMKINCVTIFRKDIIAQFSSAIFLNAQVVVLVLSGTGSISINYSIYNLEKNTTLLLSPSHLFNFNDCSRDFKCLCLLVSRQFMEEMDSTDMIYRRIRYGVTLYNEPLILLNEFNASLIAKRISEIDRAIEDTDHLYYRDMIQNRLFTFYLDLSNIIDRQIGYNGRRPLTRYESIIKTFIELLVNNYRKEHKVDFYASRLNISAHYLTQIVKRITGQSVCDFIFEMLYSEARTLLTTSKLSIQEVSTLLNFSDQSSFGKFFKRKAGISPFDYRKKQK